MQNIGKGGMIMVYKGPAVVTQSGQDVPVRYDIQNRKFQKSDSLESAVQQCPRANEGDYIVLENPSESGNFPKDATCQAIDLQKGRKVIIPGPWSQVLWPGQVATVVEGHRLRSNQFLIATIYNAEEAQKNWETGTVAVSQTESLNPEDKTLNPEDKAPERQSEIVEKKGLPKPDSFAVGTRIVIKGSDVSFYIPCTGVEVMKDKDSKYVRDAVTLEQLEYACLVDENGKKEYPRGPKVVFPKPTQVFEEDKKGRRKFRPIELNAINGIHLKVTTNFKGPDIETDVSKERDFREGEELFVTGKILSIYYPREELAVIEYGQGSKKHYS
jgi:major vault protein